MSTKTYLGIANGVAGALAAVYPDGTWDVQPVSIIDSGQDKLLDVYAAWERNSGELCVR